MGGCGWFWSGGASFSSRAFFFFLRLGQLPISGSPVNAVCVWTGKQRVSHCSIKEGKTRKRRGRTMQR